jgi:hypothetical protein
MKHKGPVFILGNVLLKQLRVKIALPVVVNRKAAARPPFLYRWMTGSAPGGHHMTTIALDHEHPVVLPHVSHFMQVPLRTRVKLPHSEHISPS